MSGIKACKCDKKFKVIGCYKHNHSYFTPRKTGKYSNYSRIECKKCGYVYRTKAKYVDQLDFAENCKDGCNYDGYYIKDLLAKQEELERENDKIFGGLKNV